MLNNNKSLKILDLSQNSITGKGASHLFNVLRDNRNIIEFYIGNNLISNRGSKTLSNAMSINTTIKKLGLERKN